MSDVPAYLAFVGDLDDVAGAQGGVGVGDEVALVGLEMLLADCLLAGFWSGRGWGRAHLFEELVVGLFGGADFDGLHHFAGGDDDAAEDLGWGAGHCWRGLGVDGVR